MRPYPEEIVRILQTGVMSHFLPELQTKYGQAQFTFSMLLFGMVTKDLDSMVPDLIEQNAALRDLLAEAAAALPRIDRDDVRAGVASLGELPPAAESLRLSALRGENEALRALLAGLAPLIEPAADDAALAPLRDVRVKVYAHLQADARKRIVPILSA